MSDQPTSPDRRGFLSAAFVASAWRSLGMAVPYARFIPVGLVPAAMAGESGLLSSLGKDELRLLNDRPINAETPAHFLDDNVTPATRMFVRNNGIPPAPIENPDAWAVRIDGEACLRPQTFSVADLRNQFDVVTLQLQLECGGNGRSEFRPRASGNQWTTGAISCANWTGARLADVLAHCGVSDAAVYVAYAGADLHLSGDATKRPISRGVPMRKALEPETLLAFEMNGDPIPLVHGAPLRLVAGGWPASASGKWVTHLHIRDRIHDGAKMMGQSYRVPCEPVAPGTPVDDDAMCIIESMPVKSLMTFPKSGVTVAKGKSMALRGHAWAGDRGVETVSVSKDFGATWSDAKLSAPVNRLAWQHFESTIMFDTPGYYEVWARATDDAGESQPMLVPGWNPKGYLNNACHRIAVKVV
ncbi:MAG: sulfite oxidase [Woeseiaceae bacterium]